MRLFLRSWLFSVMLILAVLIGPATVADDPELPTWTSVSGAEVQAAFVGVEGDQVILQPAEGDQLVIRINMLVPDDQVRVRQLQAEAGDDDDEEDDSGTARLPTLTSGPGAGNHAFYQHRNFDAVVDSRGRLRVHPKDGSGQRVGPAFTFANPGLREREVEPRRRWRSRSVDSIPEHSAPAMNPRSVQFEIVYATKENTRVRVEYTFDDNSITASSEVLEPRRPELSTHTRVSTGFPRMADFTPQTPFEERQKTLAQVSMETRRGQSRREVIVWDSRTVRGQLDDMTLTGLWGERTIRIDADNRRDGNSLSLYHYTGRPLYNGFSLRRDVSAGARAARYRLRVD